MFGPEVQARVADRLEVTNQRSGKTSSGRSGQAALR